MEDGISRTIAIQQEIIRDAKNKNSIESLMMSMSFGGDANNKENESLNAMFDNMAKTMEENKGEEDQIDSKQDNNVSDDFKRPQKKIEKKEDEEFVRPRKLTE